MTSLEGIKHLVKDYILKEILPGENPEALTDTTPLITGGILDSLATLKLVSFLEEEFSIQVQPHETGADYFNTLNDIANFVYSKQSTK